MSDNPAARHILDDVFMALGLALRPYIAEQYRSRMGDQWEFRAGLRSKAGMLADDQHRLDDASYSLGLLKSRDDEGVFGIGPSRARVRALARHLQDVRHAWAHQGPIGPAEAVDGAQASLGLLDALAVKDPAARAELESLALSARRLVGGRRTEELEALRGDYVRAGLESTAVVDLGWLTSVLGRRPSSVQLSGFYMPPAFAPLAKGDGSDAHILGSEELVRSGGTRVAVIGDVGSGKTSFLQYLHRMTLLAGGSYPSETSLFVRAPLLARALADPGLTLARAIATRLSDRFGPLYEYELGLGRLLLLVDGLDEVPADEGRRLAEALEAFVGDYVTARIIVTCRSEAYRPGESLRGAWSEFELLPLNVNDIGGFAAGVLRATGLDEDRARGEAEKFLRDLWVHTEFDWYVRVATSPLLLTTIVAIWARIGAWPAHPSELHEQILDLLVRLWPRRSRPEQDPELLIQILSHVAFRMLDDGLDPIGADRLAPILRRLAVELDGADPSNARRRAERLLGSLERHTGLFIEQGRVDGDRAYTFRHRSLLEYLAARQLVDQWIAGTPAFAGFIPRSEWAATLGLFFDRLGAHSTDASERLITYLLDTPGPLEEWLIGHLRLALRLVEDHVLPASSTTRKRVASRAASALLDPTKDLYAAEIVGRLRRLREAYPSEAPKWLPSSGDHDQERMRAVRDLLEGRQAVVHPGTSGDGSDESADLRPIRKALRGDRGGIRADFSAVVRDLWPDVPDDLAADLAGGIEPLDHPALIRVLQAPGRLGAEAAIALADRLSSWSKADGDEAEGQFATMVADVSSTLRRLPIRYTAQVAVGAAVWTDRSLKDHEWVTLLLPPPGEGGRVAAALHEVADARALFDLEDAFFEGAGPTELAVLLRAEALRSRSAPLEEVRGWVRDSAAYPSPRWGGLWGASPDLEATARQLACGAGRERAWGLYLLGRLRRDHTADSILERALMDRDPTIASLAAAAVQRADCEDAAWIEGCLEELLRESDPLTIRSLAWSLSESLTRQRRSELGHLAALALDGDSRPVSVAFVGALVLGEELFLVPRSRA